MNFRVRPVKEADLESLFDLARQFSLLNLPANEKDIAARIERSQQSFSKVINQEKRRYMFVAEDIENSIVAGCSQIKAKHGTENNPTYSFKILKKERFSRDLGIGFIHQILRLNVCTDGPTEIGGLVVSKNYRGRPEKVGRLVSLMRFMFIGMVPDDFQSQLLSELAPPLSDDGRSEFWEALGRRFTGMPYQEADIISTQNKEFIRSLFPEEDIYLCLLDARARLVTGRVGVETEPAKHMLEKIGFNYNEEVDPFDGGPHLTAKASDVSLISQAQWKKVATKEKAEFRGYCLISLEKNGEFVGGASAFDTKGDEIVLPKMALDRLGVEVGDKVYCSIYDE